MNDKIITGFIAFTVVFFTLIWAAGPVHVAEFYGSLAIGAAAGAVAFFKTPASKSVHNFLIDSHKFIKARQTK